MGFPNRWISWIKGCLDSVSFSFLINGKPSQWVKPSRGVRQGDPLSLYPFILVSQNLSHMLNYARSIDLIPDWCSTLTRNFNHLMYADDLIIITHATRRVARNVKLCLSIYSSLNGQTPNLSKSNIYLPHWFNKRVASSLKSILNINIGVYPFVYLGILISFKKLAAVCFQSMVDKVNKIVGGWNRSKLSKPGKDVLIKSILMAIPVYYLSVYPIPDYILDKISTCARKFLWASGGNSSGIPLVNWQDAMLSKSEEGI